MMNQKDLTISNMRIFDKEAKYLITGDDERDLHVQGHTIKNCNEVKYLEIITSVEGNCKQICTG